VKIISLEQQNLKKVGHCHGSLLSGYDQDEKDCNDIAATQKCTRFQSMPGHSKGIGRNLSIPTKKKCGTTRSNYLKSWRR